MLVLSRKIGQGIILFLEEKTVRIIVSDIRKSGNTIEKGQVRIAIEAPPEMAIWREEIAQEMKKEMEILEKEPTAERRIVS